MFFFFSSRRRHTRFKCDWSSDVCSSDLNSCDTRGMWQEFAEVLPRIWTEQEISYDGTYYKIPRREVLPKPLQRPHPPLWSACGSDETARLTGSLGMGGLLGSEGGPDRRSQLMTLYQGE